MSYQVDETTSDVYVQTRPLTYSTTYLEPVSYTHLDVYKRQGVSVFNQDLRDFEFRPGAIFANVVVGDEINRASPKTQSALLELSLIHI